MTAPFPIGEFERLAPLGRGEFGRVDCARWRPRALDVALKDVEPRAGTGHVDAEREGAGLQQRIAAECRGIVPDVYLHGTGADGHYYIAMEYVRGESLHALLRQRRCLPSEEAARIGASLARALQRLHEFRPDGPGTPVRPIVHADLKPEHVLLLGDGTLRIIDFGIAKHPATGAVTQSGFVSVEYALPERLIDANVHPDDDVWALGVILFEMLSGEHPRERWRTRIADAVKRNDWTAASLMLREEPGTLPPGCPPPLDAVVRKMLASQAEHRYRTAAAAARDLEQFLAGRETEAWAQLVAAGRATRVVPRGAVAAPGAPTVQVPPLPRISPLPSPSSAATATVKPAAAVAVKPVAPRRRVIGTVVRGALTLFVVMMLLAEGGTWVKAQRLLDRLPTLSLADVDTLPDAIARVRRGAPFGIAVPLRVVGPLSAKLTDLAEPTIADFRSDTPSAREGQWKRVERALTLAQQLRPHDPYVAARRKYVDGQVARIESKGRSVEAARPLMETALADFRDAARLDRRWPDPFLGMAAIHAYGLGADFDALLKDVTDAGQRGFAAGRRERSQVGDGYRGRADQEHRAAASAEGEARRQFLEQAGADYQSCVQQYAGVTGFFNSDQNADYCRRRTSTVAHELEELQNEAP